VLATRKHGPFKAIYRWLHVDGRTDNVAFSPGNRRESARVSAIRKEKKKGKKKEGGKKIAQSVTDISPREPSRESGFN